VPKLSNITVPKETFSAVPKETYTAVSKETYMARASSLHAVVVAQDVGVCDCSSFVFVQGSAVFGFLCVQTCRWQMSALVRDKTNVWVYTSCVCVFVCVCVCVRV